MPEEDSGRPWLEDLEGDALPSLIKSDAPKIRVVAGPGAGKSEGLERRVHRLLAGVGVEPESIFVGTFTRAIRADLAETLEEHAPEGVRVSTLHALALELLSDNPHVLSGRSLQFLLEFEKKAMLYDVRSQIDDDRKIKKFDDDLKQIEAAHAEQQPVQHAVIEGEVDRWLRAHEGMLIEEVVPTVTEALEARDIEPGLFDHVIIDEYQDLTKCEQHMVELIWSGDGSLTVMGDNNQSIYGFRYNHPEGIDRFKQRHDDVYDLSIPDNWRSGREIVEVANRMVVEAGSVDDQMKAKRDIEGETTLVQWPSVEEEVQGLSKYLRAHHDESFLVLVPRRFIGYQIRDKVGNDARTEFHQEVLDYPLTQERFALASLVADPDDKIALRSWLGFHWQGGLAKERNSSAYRSSFTPKISASRLVTEIADGTRIVDGEGSKNVRRRSERLLRILDEIPDGVHDRIDYLFDPSLSTRLEDEKKASWAARDLRRLQNAAHRVVESSSGQIGLKRVMEKLRYRIATRAPLIEAEKDARIRILTLHSAKGLEADRIVVAGAADQMIPGKVDDEDEREEQRRLLYVAITRARDSLLISWPRRLPYSDAKQNHVRIDKSNKAEDESYVRLAKSSLLPSGAPTPSYGPNWLRSVL